MRLEEKINKVLQEGETNEWQDKFLLDIMFKLKKKNSFVPTNKQSIVLNRMFQKVNVELLPVENEENKIIEKLSKIVERTKNNTEDNRADFFHNLQKFYNERGFLSAKQQMAIQKFDLNYSKQKYTARPKGGR